MAEEAEQISYPNSDNISVLALRLLSTAGGNGTHEKDEQQQDDTEEPGGDPLESAIAEIEAVIKEYEGEFDK